ncbi:hypothetical protein EJ05DRAFT_511633 [Pseudovirgaria hyperparasitica]|uniref:YDG domain-containing protein n=1 Tax=Pseudovirgaria hyperparasitica TaxID=470096 RepID=A0A6A6W6Z7_9PEZI|nr:uncharacterized protein EJ05DRAFT_511633 [Pseudovirgaria hyperparasitica]KAF2756851.1 hypothetical protein EJ05DRAFT_511633 [Pseudovirgaria hyperparasitica]
MPWTTTHPHKRPPLPLTSSTTTNTRHNPRPPTLPPSLSALSPIPLSKHHLRLVASWIRNDLDPLVAREGPDVLHPDDVLTLHDLFVRVRADGSCLPTTTTAGGGAGTVGGVTAPTAEITASTLRSSRLHFAVMEIAGKATRWPGKLADECDGLVGVWEARFGRLDALRPFLFGVGGRLVGVAGTGDLARAGLLKLWSFSCPERLLPARSKKHGGLGFVPGSWWINGMFACHAGIIDIETTDGGVCFDEHGAYAVVLKDDSEVEGSSPHTFTYRCGARDRGRFRLTGADSKARWPVRVLRSHALNSLWAPKVGIRYDGLHRVIGWSIKPVRRTGGGGGGMVDDGEPVLVFEVTFQREPNEEVDMDEVLRHPLADEVDDYLEYKRLRQKRGVQGPEHVKAVFSDESVAPPASSAPGMAAESLEHDAGKPLLDLLERKEGSEPAPSFFPEPDDDGLPTPRQHKLEAGAGRFRAKLTANLPGFTLSIPTPAISPALAGKQKKNKKGKFGSQTTSATGSTQSVATGTSGESGVSRQSRGFVGRKLGSTDRTAEKEKEKEAGRPGGMMMRGSVFAPPPPPSSLSRLNVKRGGARKPSIFAKMLEGPRSRGGSEALDGVDERPEEWEVKACREEMEVVGGGGGAEGVLEGVLSPRQTG